MRRFSTNTNDRGSEGFEASAFYSTRSRSLPTYAPLRSFYARGVSGGFAHGGLLLRYFGGSGELYGCRFVWSCVGCPLMAHGIGEARLALVRPHKSEGTSEPCDILRFASS